MQKRAELYARLLVTRRPCSTTSPAARGIPADQLSGLARTTADVPIPLHGARQRGASEPDPRLARALPARAAVRSVGADPRVYAEAPSWPEAQRLADSCRSSGWRTTCGSSRSSRGSRRRSLPVLRQLGSARGGITNSKARIVIGAADVLHGLRAGVLRPAPATAPPPPRGRRRERTGAAAPVAHGPRGRGLAAHDAGAAMGGRGPDRDVLAHAVRQDPAGVLDADRHDARPARAADRRRIWLIAFTAGPGAAPRLRFTRVHLALGVFLACAFLSVVLDAALAEPDRRARCCRSRSCRCWSPTCRSS